MSEKIKAIVLKSSDRKEKDKNILLFSLEKGKLWATLKGVKGPKAKMKTAQNPFTFAEFLLEDGKAGKIVTGFEPIENFHEISEDIDKYFEGCGILEILDILGTQQENVKLFLLALNALKSLCFKNVRPLYVLDKFLLEVFAEFGTPIYSDKCSCCGNVTLEKFYLDLKDGELVCSACKTFTCEELSKATYMALKILSKTKFESLHTLKLAQESEISLLKVLVKNFQTRFDKKPHLMGILS